VFGRLFPTGSRARQMMKRLLLTPRVPAHIAQNFVSLSDSDINLLKQALAQGYFSGEPDGYLATSAGRKDLLDHLTGRLEHDRTLTIPWLDSIGSLKNARVLEIGCGTGSSTVALAEQGARVTAIDIDEISLSAARARCNLYGLSASLHHMNATEVAHRFSRESFDLIVFWASLEHMTHDERIIAIQDTWDMLPPGGLWCVTDTPNRLHFCDSHTSLLPFFLWLPDDLAIDYASFSPRQRFRERIVGRNSQRDPVLSLVRSGRGISYHEFEIAIEPVDTLNVISSMHEFRRKGRILPLLKLVVSREYRYEYRYESFLHRLCPTIHRGFLQPYLDLVLKKR